MKGISAIPTPAPAVFETSGAASAFLPVQKNAEPELFAMILADQITGRPEAGETRKSEEVPVKKENPAAEKKAESKEAKKEESEPPAEKLKDTEKQSDQSGMMAAVRPAENRTDPKFIKPAIDTSEKQNLNTKFRDSLYAAFSVKSSDKKSGTTEILVKGLDPEKWKITKPDNQSDLSNAQSLKIREAGAGLLQQEAKVLIKNENNQSAEMNKKAAVKAAEKHVPLNTAASAEVTEGSKTVNHSRKEDTESGKPLPKMFQGITPEESGTGKSGGNETGSGQSSNERKLRSAEQDKSAAENKTDKTSGNFTDLLRKENTVTDTRNSITTESTKPGQSEITEMMNRLAVKAKINISSDGSSTASVRMHPENLGFMTLNLKISEGKAEGRILVENQTAMKLIRDEIETLKTELRNQGISLESFTVRVRDSASSQFSGFSESRQDSAAFSGFGESGQPDGERRNPEMASGRERNSNVSDGSADRITDQFPEPAISAVKEFRGFEISL